MKAHLDGLARTDGTVFTDAKGRPVSYRIVAEEMRTIKKKMKHEKASYYKTHGLRKNATIELYLAGCDDEMVKAVTGHSGVEMLKKYGGPIRQRELAKRAQEARGKRQEIKWNEARPKRESFNGCFKNSSEGEMA
ncbi:tyrosine-type recombinase/integrase [Palleronia caenipelagi]|uniref:tyrosine-type recombinase/integrase n=1 Tax=Palleronia caenipelagi TaxID=2489174 RepID=UPI001FEC8D36|nr:tyrosine-type recombinase/integrase [Palleronia caenipelagi]